MNDLLRPIYEKIADSEDILGVLIIEKTQSNSPLTEQFDAIVIVLTRNSEVQGSPYDVEHYYIDNKMVAVHIIEESKFLECLSGSNRRRYLLWVLNGRILLDQDEYLAKLREELLEFPIDIRKKKIAIEFAKLIRCYSNGKELYEKKQYLDAFNLMVQALHHLARLSVIEHGFYPEVTVWNQVKRIEPEVYALYLELVESSERIEKRVELLLLAIEFAISSRSRIGSSYLIEIMKSKKEAWTISELVNDRRLKDFSMDVALLLHYLETKNMVQINDEAINGQNIFQRKYTVK